MRPLIQPRVLRALLIVWAAAMAVFAFTDLGISRAVVDFDSGLGRFVAVYGELPGALVGLAGLVVASAGLGWAGKPVTLALQLLLGVVGAYAVAYVVGLVSRAATGDFSLLERWGFLVLIGGGVLVLAVGALLARARPPGAKARRFAWAAIWMSIGLVLVVVLVLKGLWGRVRFQDLDPAAAAYTPWVLPQGPTGHHSFPSGHTAWGWLVLPLLVWVADAQRRRRLLVTGALVAWGLVVAVGRVRYGAHYASDVTFTTGAALVVLVAVDRLWVRRQPAP